MPDQLRVDDSERVDRSDVDFLAASPQAFGSQLGGSFLTNASGSRVWVLDGFKPVANPSVPLSSKQVLVARGTGMFAMKDHGQVVHGIITTEGDTQKILDLSANANGFYALWARFELVDSAGSNRIFWDDVAGGEFVKPVSTRKTAKWGLTTTSYPVAYPTVPSTTNAPISPGAEWCYLGYVEIQTSSMVVTPDRALYFEGYEGDSYAQTWTDPRTGVQMGWGDGANDRNVNRSTYGLKDLHTFVNAALRKIEEIQSGTARWWTEPVEPLDQKVSRNGDLTLDGDYLFSGALNSVTILGTLVGSGLIQANAGLRCATPQAIGQAGARFTTLYAQGVDLTGLTQAVRIGTTTSSSVTIENQASALEYGEIFYNVIGTNFMGIASDASILVIAGGGAGTAGFGVDSVEPLVPGTGSAGVYLGKTASKWREIHGFKMQTTSLQPYNATGDVLGATGNAFDAFLRTVALSGSITPTVDNSFNIGSTSFELASVWARAVSGVTSINGKSATAVAFNAGGKLTFSGVAAGFEFDFGLVKIVPGLGQVALHLNPTDDDPEADSFFFFDGVETSTFPTSTDEPPGTVYNNGTQKFVSVHVKDGGSFQTRWIECLRRADLPGYVP